MTRRTGKCRNGVAGWRLGCTLPDRSRLVGTDPGHLSSGQQFLKGSTVTYQRATKSVCWSVKAILSAEEMPADSEGDHQGWGVDSLCRSVTAGARFAKCWRELRIRLIMERPLYAPLRRSQRAFHTRRHRDIN